MFNLRGDPDPRNNPPGLPVLDILMSIPFLIGLGVMLWRWRRPAFGVTLLAGAIMLIPTVLSEYAPALSPGGGCRADRGTAVRPGAGDSAGPAPR